MNDTSMHEKQRGEMRSLSDDIGPGPAQGGAARPVAEAVAGAAAGRMAALVADSPAILYAARADGSFALTVVSDNFSRITGYDPAEALADPGFWVGRVHPEDLAQVRAALASPETGDVACRDFRFRFADGTWHWLRDRCRLRRDEAGRPVELSGSWLEVGEVRAALDALDRANAELEQFAYVASHDLREPLRMISSYMGLLVRRYGDQLDDDAREFTNFARAGADRMDRLILDLLEYSRVGRWNRTMTELDLGEVADQAACTLDAQVRAAGATVEIARGMPTVVASWEEILRLFQDLIGNALKYRDTGRPPVVRVSARRDGEFWLVSVADNGIGIAAEHFERIFLIFQRLHTRDQFEGTGIGLAIAKKVVERHGGRLWLESVPGQGSTFSFTLPARPE
jgi:signal transduction histidine kinase